MSMATRKTGKIEAVEKVWLSREEAKAYLGCSDDLLRDLRNNAEVGFAKFRNFVWYDLRSIERFMRRNTVVKK
mgnify:FL=1